MNFEQLLSSLNPAQKKAVNAIEGAVMVVAGPGTGKTQVLGARIANILQQTDCHPENILCLTFTEAATVALRNRLYEFIGSAAHRVNIYTYHAFCNMVIQDNKNHFGYQDLEAASDLETLEVVKEIIDELPSDHVLKRLKGEVYFDSKNLLQLFSLMKKDRHSPQKIESEAKEYLQMAANSEVFRLKRKTNYGKAGDLKKEYYVEEERIQKLIAASALFFTYQTKLLERRRYDYNDMINWVIDAFNSEENLLLQYQEQYQYVLVDEYQDTNGSQNELLYLLINYWDNPNVFVVGDDDQSIYKFQGANVENIFHFQQRYKNDIQLVVLEENYRSIPSILQASGSVIEHNNERLIKKVEGLSKTIRSANPALMNSDGKVEIHSYPNTYQEVIGIANEIKKMKSEGVSFKDIAILYRNHDQSNELVKYLQAEKIPFNVSVSQNILEVPIVKQVLKLLEYLQKEWELLDSGEEHLYEILHFTRFKKLRSFEIAKLAADHKDQYEKGFRESIREAISSGKPPYMHEESVHELRQFLDDIDYWIKKMATANLQTLVEQVMAKGGFISQALASSDNIFEVQCLKTLFNFIKEETAKRPHSTLKDLLRTLDLLRVNNLKLSLNKVIHGKDGVNLMTAHGSKGLEFDHVFVMGCTANKWEKNGQTLPFYLDRIISGEPDAAFEEEGRRLFYVALTRAKRSLKVTYAVLNENDKPMNKSVYVHELEESDACISFESEVDELLFMEFFNKTIDPVTEEFKGLTQLDFVDKQLENFRLSATNLNNYLKCPVSFFYQNIVRVPSAKNENMTFGSAMHFALEAYFREMLQTDQKVFPDNEFLIKRFKQHIDRHRESFTEESYERFMALGEQSLTALVEERKFNWEAHKDLDIEVSIKNVEIDGVPIRGILDKLIFNSESIQVVDYKTGKYSNARSKTKPPVDPDQLKEGETDHNKIYGGDYWRQVVFYKLLVESDPRFNKPVDSGLLEFVEAEGGVFNQIKITIEPGHLQEVKQQIKRSYDAILNKEFNHGCNKSDCVWCNFNHFYLNKESDLNAELLKVDFDEIDER